MDEELGSGKLTPVELRFYEQIVIAQMANFSKEYAHNSGADADSRHERAITSIIYRRIAAAGTYISADEAKSEGW